MSNLKANEKRTSAEPCPVWVCYKSQLKVFPKVQWSSSPENGSKVIKTLQIDALHSVLVPAKAPRHSAPYFSFSEFPGNIDIIAVTRRHLRPPLVTSAHHPSLDQESIELQASVQLVNQNEENRTELIFSL